MEPWLIFAYVTGTVAGLIIGRQSGYSSGAKETMEFLIHNGYLRIRRLGSGMTEISKLDVEDSD
jgi:hypothetical protein